MTWRGRGMACFAKMYKLKFTAKIWQEFKLKTLQCFLFPEQWNTLVYFRLGWSSPLCFQFGKQNIWIHKGYLSTIPSPESSVFVIIGSPFQRQKLLILHTITNVIISNLLAVPRVMAHDCQLLYHWFQFCNEGRFIACHKHDLTEAHILVHASTSTVVWPNRYLGQGMEEC